MAEYRYKVLLVEDDEDDYIITKDLFEEIASERYLLDWIDNYESAQQVMDELRHDIYLIDYRLGPYNGLDLLRRAVARGCQAPVILLTGLGDDQIDIEAMRSGAADYLVKGQISAALLERSISHSLQRKKVEQKLRESEEKYRLLFDKNPHPMWVVDRESFGFLAVNEAAIAHYGYEREEFLAMGLAELLSPEKREGSIQPSAKLLAEPLASGETWHHYRKDGSAIKVEVTWNAIDFEGRAAALVLANDVTQRLELEAQLRQSQKMESVGTLAGGIAHDFNNILGIISGYAIRLRSQQAEPAKWEGSIQAIETAAHRGAGLVRQILTFARKTDVFFESIEVNTLVEELAKMLEGTFPKTVSLSLDLEKQIPPITADPSQLHQSLLNLCVNGRDAMPAGGTLQIQTRRVEASELKAKYPDAQARDYVWIRVADTGAGMDETTRSRLFEPFFTTKSRDQGSGLGLAVVYGIIKSHRGYLDVESEPGQGTAFNLFLPIVVGATESRQESPSVAHDWTGHGETILLVEDEELLVELLRELLEEHGYKALVAHDGLEAVAVYRKHQAEIALVIVDMGLPKLGGWEAFLKMKELNRDVKAIFASGYLEPEIKSNILKAGAADFVQKPYVPDELFARVRQVLDAAATQE